MQVWSIYIKEYTPFVMSSVLGQGNTNLFYRVSSMAFNDFTVSQIEANVFFHWVLHKRKQDDNYVTYTGSFNFLYSLLLVQGYFTDNSVREKPYSPRMSSEVKLCSGMLTSNNSLCWMLKSLFLSFNGGVNTRPVCVINLTGCHK